MTVWVSTSNHGTLNLRQTATSNGIVVARIPHGTQLDDVTKEGDWYKVNYKGYCGYVKAEFISTTSPAASSISKDDLKAIYNSLQSALKTIESILNK